MVTVASLPIPRPLMLQPSATGAPQLPSNTCRMAVTNKPHRNPWHPVISYWTWVWLVMAVK